MGKSAEFKKRKSYPIGKFVQKQEFKMSIIKKSRNKARLGKSGKKVKEWAEPLTQWQFMFKACFDGLTGAARWERGWALTSGLEDGTGAGKRITNDSDSLGTKEGLQIQRI